MKKLNIVFMGMNSRFSIIPLKELAKKHNIIAIIESAPRNHKRKKFGYKDLIWQVYLKIKKNKNLKKENVDSLKKIAIEKNIPYIFSENISDIDIEKQIKELKPDLICVASFSQLLKRNILDVPKHGAINFHPSYLPNYRGPNPWFWQYYYMEKEGGVTIHFIDDGEDTGDIIYQEKYPITLGMKSTDMWDIAIPLGASLICKAIDDIATGSVVRKKQVILNKIVRARNVKPDEKMIDWENWEVERVYHVLRGTYTWLNSIGKLPRGTTWNVIGYEKSSVNSNFKPGEIFSDNDKLWICCKCGRIQISIKFDFKSYIISFLT